MSASFQALPPPSMALPTGGSSGEGRHSSHSSSGSFGMVFIVLAIILVISAIACFLGRLCSKKSRKSHHPRAHKQGHGNGNGNNHFNHNNHHHGGVYPRDRDLEFGFRSKEGDIMPPLGFEPQERDLSTAKVANRGDFRGYGMSGGMEHGGEHGNFQ